MPSNPTRSDLSYWNKQIAIQDDRHIDARLGPTKIGKNNYYGRKIKRAEKAEIVFKKIIPVLFISVVLAPVAIPCLLTFTDLYRKTGRWMREVHYGRKLACINNIAGQALQSKSTSATHDCVDLDSNQVPLEVLDLVFSKVPFFNNKKEVSKYFDTLSVVCKAWNSRVEKAKLNGLNAGRIKLYDLPRMETKEAGLNYIKAHAHQLVSLNLFLYKMTNEDILSIARCKNLQKLVLQGHNIGDNINLLTQLKKLTITIASNLNISAFNLPELEELELSTIEPGEWFPEFEYLPKLKSLKIIKIVKELVNLPSIDSICQLECLAIINNRYLDKIPSLKKFSQLKNLQISYNPSLTAIPDLDSLINLKTLRIDHNDKIQSLPSFNSLIELEKLTISGCKSLLALPSFEFLSKLKDLEIEYNPVLQSIPPFVGLVNLESLSIYENKSLMLITSLEGLTNLQFLWIGNNESLPSIPPLEGLILLTTLYITNNNSLEKIPSLKTLTQLKSLDIDNPSLKEIPSLDHLSLIREVLDPLQFNQESVCQQI